MRFPQQQAAADALPGYERRHYWLHDNTPSTTVVSPSEGDVELRVRELCQPREGTGARVWHCAIVLARWLYRCVHWQLIDFNVRRVEKYAVARRYDKRGSNKPHWVTWRCTGRAA